VEAVISALAAHAQADKSARKAWQALITALDEEGFTPLFIRPAGNGFQRVAISDLPEADQQRLKALRDAARRYYGWSGDTAAGNDRQWRYRVAKSLAKLHGGELLTAGGGKRKADQPAADAGSAGGEGSVVLTAEQATALNEALLACKSAKRLAEAKRHAETALTVLEAAAR